MSDSSQAPIRKESEDISLFAFGGGLLGDSEETTTSLSKRAGLSAAPKDQIVKTEIETSAE